MTVISDSGLHESTALSISKMMVDIANFLLAKNAAYGDSALNPVRIFSKADKIEQINVRIDDKISRLMRADEETDLEDVELDLIGYLVLRRIARLKAQEKTL